MLALRLLLVVCVLLAVSAQGTRGRSNPLTKGRGRSTGRGDGRGPARGGPGGRGRGGRVPPGNGAKKPPVRKLHEVTFRPEQCDSNPDEMVTERGDNIAINFIGKATHYV